MQIRAYEPRDLDGVYRILVTGGWEHRIASPENLERLIAVSQRNVVAQIDGEVIGFARAITDGLSNGYLSMVVVDAARRRQGVGRALVQHLIKDADGVTWVLRAGRPGASDFFARLGFVASTEAMELPRR